MAYNQHTLPVQDDGSGRQLFGASQEHRQERMIEPMQNYQHYSSYKHGHSPPPQHYPQLEGPTSRQTAQQNHQLQAHNDYDFRHDTSNGYGRTSNHNQVTELQESSWSQPQIHNESASQEEYHNYYSHAQFRPNQQSNASLGHQGHSGSRLPTQRSRSDELVQRDGRARFSDLQEAQYTSNRPVENKFSGSRYDYGPGKKPRRILAEQPPSPQTLSWDNPFPTFPTVVPKKKGAQDGTDQRSETVNGRRSQDSSRSQPKQHVRSGNAQQYDSQKTYIEDSSQGPAISRLDPTDPEEPKRNSKEPYHSQQSVDNTAIQQRLQSNQSKIGNMRSDEAPSPHSFNTSQRSNTMPASVTNQMVHPNLPVRGLPTESNISKSPAPTQQLSLTSGPPQADHPPTSYQVQQSYSGRELSAQPDGRKFNKPTEDSYEDVFDSYYDESGRIQPHEQSLRHMPRTPLEEDMPNFDAVAIDRPALRIGKTTDELYLQPPQTTVNAKTIPHLESRGRPAKQNDNANFQGQAQRSRSQPNYKDHRQVNNANQGLDFGAGEIIPQVPPINTGEFGQQKNQSMSRNGIRQMDGSYRPSPAQGYSRAPIVASHDPQYRRQLDDRGLSANQRVSPGRGPNAGIRSGAFQAPLTHGSLTGMRVVPSGRSFGSGNGPIRPGRFNSPPGHKNGPDSLPEHPIPVRPGLLQMQSPGPSQPAKPPPVRQYNIGPSPNSQPGSQQSLAPSFSQRQDKVESVTHDELQRLTQIVQVNPNDMKIQLLLAQKLIEAVTVLADEGGRADLKTRNRNREKFILDAHKILKRLANNGNTEAMFFLADCHGRSLLGPHTDVKEAFNIYQSAAKLGHAQSAYRVAVCCELGQEEGGGTRRDPLKAIQWYKRAATLGDTPAMYKMGMIQLKGLLGQTRNPREAIVWLKRAAERADADNPHALHELGLLFETASGNDNIVRDESYSLQLFTQAAELGYKFSQYRIGTAYEYGLLGCPIDPRQSIAWYSKAAVQEEHQSELALSGWYLTGSEGVLQQSDTEAYLWARKAAQAGLAKAEYAMGYFTEVGIGAPSNIEDAKRWYWMAASQNFPKARERLEDLRKGGARMQKSRVSRSAMNKSEGDCVIM